MMVIGYEITGEFLGSSETFAAKTLEESKELADARRLELIKELMEDVDGLVCDLKRDGEDPLKVISEDIKITETMVEYDSMNNFEDYND